MTKIEVRSIIGQHLTVTIDPYGVNPMAEDVKQAAPALLDAITSRQGPPPRMFTGGTADLPAFTASGAEPRMLLRLPYGVRHYAASLPSMSEVQAVFEEYSEHPIMSVTHERLTEAKQRMLAWANGNWDLGYLSRLTERRARRAKRPEGR